MAISAVIGSAVVGAVSAKKQASATKKAAKENKRAAERTFQQEKKMAEVQNIRSIRQQVRNARTAGGSITNTAALGGTMGSSGLLGGLSSVQGQLASNVDYTRTTAGISQAINQIQLTNAQKQAGYAQSNAQWGAIGSVAGSVFSAAGGYGTVFGANTQAPAPVREANIQRVG